MIAIFLHYVSEENGVIRFLRNLREGVADPLNQIPKRAIIANRYRTMQGLYKANCPINHGSLASTLVANESTRNSLPKFINNILILTGVFGTIVSLSIALIGASDLLATSVDVGGMGMVVHNMSTALSTTSTFPELSRRNSMSSCRPEKINAPSPDFASATMVMCFSSSIFS
ncbi:MAG: hypothetical protein P8101_11000, partial [Candidatus Thiodiazotropha sp.]